MHLLRFLAVRRIILLGAAFAHAVAAILAVADIADAADIIDIGALVVRAAGVVVDAAVVVVDAAVVRVVVAAFAVASVGAHVALTEQLLQLTVAFVCLEDFLVVVAKLDYFLQSALLQNRVLGLAFLVAQRAAVLCGVAGPLLLAEALDRLEVVDRCHPCLLRRLGEAVGGAVVWDGLLACKALVAVDAAVVGHALD